MQTEIAIIGGGLSGLYSAYLLQQQGIKATVFEARDRIGGRILSKSLTNNEDASRHQRYDLGPSWFWPEIHPRMSGLIDKLNLTAFPQQQRGAHVFDRGRHTAPQRYDLGMMSSPQSMRVAGGMYSLIEALAEELENDSIQLNSTMTAIKDMGEKGVELNINQNGTLTTVSAQSVIIALPPRLIAETIEFNPALPPHLIQHFANTMTWMAAHAKFVAVYEENFWQKQGLSGSASSQTGPLMEVHDASAIEGKPALFGFIGLNAAARKSAGKEQLINVTLGQLSHLFGEEAGHPTEVFLLDWSDERFTATTDDHVGANSHPHYGLPSEANTLWGHRLMFAGTEAAKTDGGYLEGALNASELAVQALNH